MARVQLSGAFLFVCLLSSVSCEPQNLQADDLKDLRAELGRLNNQIQEAQNGEAAARKLLEEGQITHKSFETEVKNLKATLSSKGNQEDALQKQIQGLQKEVQNLKADQKLGEDLKHKFQKASQELQATKDTLAKTIGQLAERSNSASEAGSAVSEAKRALQEAQKERDGYLAKLQGQESTAKETLKLEQQLDREKASAAKLQATIGGLKSETSNLKSEITGLKAELESNKKEVSTWRAKTVQAEKAVKSAELTLEKALKEHSATQSALIQAESKAEEAVKKMEALLTSWLPHWLDDRYHQVLHKIDPAVKKVQPTVSRVWKQSVRISKQGQAHVLTGYSAVSKQSAAAWKQARPALDRLLKQVKALWQKYSKKAVAVAGPQLRRAQAQIAYQSQLLRKRVSTFLDRSPQIRSLRRHVKRVIRDLENLAIKTLKQVPVLKPYAKRPEVTYLVWAILLAPVSALLLPLLAFKGERRQKKVALETRNIALGRGGVTPERPARPTPKAKKASRS